MSWRDIFGMRSAAVSIRLGMDSASFVKRSRRAEEAQHAYSLGVTTTGAYGATDGGKGTSECLDHCRTTSVAGVRTTANARRWVFVGARLLGVWRRWVLLGAGHLGARARARVALDSW